MSAEPAARGSLLGRVALPILERVLADLEGGALELRLPDGSTRTFGQGPRVAVTVESARLARRLATRGKLGLGESYAAGEWRAEDLVGLLELLLRNAEVSAARHPTLWRLAGARPRLRPCNGPRRSRRNIRYHYDLGNELFQLFLDESLTYSCAYWEHPGETLAQAQQNKYRRICDKLELGPDDRLLEIGCGFGGFALHAARERAARVTAVTISERQHELGRRRVAEAGLEGQVEILLRDYRELQGSFTKIASIEMFEAIGYRQFEPFFAACDRLLAPGGLVCLQTIAIPDQRFERYRRTPDWIERYVFPGCLLPSLTAISNAMTRGSRLILYSLEDIGIHYAETLRCWRERFLASLDDVHRLGYDERFVRVWDFYLAYCEAAFRTRSLRDLQLVLTRSFNDRLPRYPAPRVSL